MSEEMVTIRRSENERMKIRISELEMLVRRLMEKTALKKTDVTVVPVSSLLHTISGGATG